MIILLALSPLVFVGLFMALDAARDRRESREWSRNFCEFIDKQAAADAEYYEAMATATDDIERDFLRLGRMIRGQHV
jgi:hypothetical protein